MTARQLLTGAALLLTVAACRQEGATTGRETAGDTAAVATGANEMLRVEEVTLGRAIDANKVVVEELENFRTTDTIYASVRTTGTAPTAQLRARWTYQDGQVVSEETRDIAPDGPEVTEFHIAKPDGWPKGEYRVTVTLNGNEVGTEEFEVE